MRAIFTTVIILLSCAELLAQNENVVGDFTADEVNGKVYLTWIIQQGETCNGITILRSTDSVNFNQIGSIEGTCGSIQEAVPYDFTDLYPEKNSINYYRLDLGGVGFSKIIQIEVIDISANNYLLRPNPVTEFSELHFANDGNHLIELKVYTDDGKLVHQEQTTDELILLNRQDFNPGSYFFVLVNTQTEAKIKGRFEVQ